MNAWRLILHDEEPAEWNMAVDVAMLEAVELGLVAPTIRLYRWRGAAISLGRLQRAERALRLDRSCVWELPVVRRPTGGRGILHGGDQTLSLAARLETLHRDARPVLGLYRLTSAGMREAIEALGVRLIPGERSSQPLRTGDCFSVRTDADLVVEDGGAKLIGSAQYRSSGAVLQQTSIRHLPTRIVPEDVFQDAVVAPTYPLAHITVEALLGELVAGLAKRLGIRLREDSLCQWEIERASALCAEGRFAECMDEAHYGLTSRG